MYAYLKIMRRIYIIEVLLFIDSQSIIQPDLAFQKYGVDISNCSMGGEQCPTLIYCVIESIARAIESKTRFLIGFTICTTIYFYFIKLALTTEPNRCKSNANHESITHVSPR